MIIALATDHAGFEQLKELRKYLEELSHECQDFGPKKFDPEDDYPDFMRPAAEAVAAGGCEVGIILGGSGQGEAMAANRIPGARCTLFYGPAVPRQAVDASGKVSHDPYEILRLSRQHNHANMLSLGARFLSVEEMKQAIKVWLDTPFSDEPRHARRVEKLG
jgi:ribose 5-phosphate isomerase B